MVQAFPTTKMWALENLDGYQHVFILKWTLMYSLNPTIRLPTLIRLCLYIQRTISTFYTGESKDSDFILKHAVGQSDL